MKKERKIILIFGKTGSGKSTLVKQLIKDVDRKIIIDIQHEYSEGIIFESYADFYEFITTHGTGKSFNYIIRFENDEEYEKLFLLVYYIGNLYLIVEEAEDYISPDKRKSNFNKLINRGRHKRISIIAIARRSVELSRRLRGQVDRIYSFKQTQIEDIIIMKKIGFKDLSFLPSLQDDIKINGFNPDNLDKFYAVVEY